MILRSGLIASAIAATALAGAFIAPAFAGCSDRPGTPTNIKVDSAQGQITIRWHDTTQKGEGSCHDIEVKRTDNGDTSKSVIGGVCLSGGTDGVLVVPNLPFGKDYCVRLKARDHAGTKGCVSQNWSATVCGSSLFPPIGRPGNDNSPPRIADFEPGTDRPGNDIGPPFAVPNDGMCSRACSDNDRCEAWTFVKAGVQGPKALCYLKNPAPAPRPAACCVSGGHSLIVR